METCGHVFAKIIRLLGTAGRVMCIRRGIVECGIVESSSNSDLVCWVQLRNPYIYLFSSQQDWILVLNWSQFRVNSKEWWEQLENTPLSFPRCHSNLEIIKKRNVWEPWLVFLKWQCSLKDIVCFPKTYLLQKMPMSFTKVRWDQKWSHISSGAIHSLLSNLDRVQNC